MDQPATVSWDGSDVNVTVVEKQLARLWGELAERHGVPHAVRTTLCNLVVFAADGETADRISRSLEQLTQRYHSRAVLLVADRASARPSVDVRARVSCQEGPGDSHVCYEHITITGHGRAADHLGSTVAPLLLPELPTYLWWPGQPPFNHRTFHRLLDVADRLIVDSADFQAPGDAFAELSRLFGGRHAVNDFNWARLTPSTDIIAQFFDGPTWAPYAYGILSARVEFGAGGYYERVTAGTLLLLAWVGVHLGWEPETTLDTIARHDIQVSVLQGERLIPIELQFRDHGAEAAGRLIAIEIVSQPKGMPPARFTVQRTEADLDNAYVRMEIHEGATISRVVPLHLKTEIELLVDELDMAGRDVLYEKVAEMAGRMAGREAWVPA